MTNVRKLLLAFSLKCGSVKLQGEKLDLVRASDLIRSFVEDNVGDEMPIPAKFSPTVVASLLQSIEHVQITGNFDDAQVPKDILVQVILFSDFLQASSRVCSLSTNMPAARAAINVHTCACRSYLTS